MYHIRMYEYRARGVWLVMPNVSSQPAAVTLEIPHQSGLQSEEKEKEKEKKEKEKQQE